MQIERRLITENVAAIIQLCGLREIDIDRMVADIVILLLHITFINT